MSEKANILVIDDEQAICFAFTRYFQQRGYGVQVAASAAAGLEAFKSARPDVVFLDVRLSDGSGLELLGRLRQIDPAVSIVIISAYGSLEVVMQAIRGQAFDYMVKPLDLDRARELVEQACASRAARAMPPDIPRPAHASIVGSSAAMQDVYKQIGRVSQSDAAVLIQGSTGTGKELVARAIHDYSARAGRPFVAVNCGALPEHLVESELFGYERGAFTGASGDKPGRFESAQGGTLLLDEVGDLPLAAQVKLLRFLDSQTIERLGSVKSINLDVRILAATNHDLHRAIEAGRFRSDLYYRLAVIQIQLPALTQRKDDILPLAKHFLAACLGGGRTPVISDPAAALLAQYAWPGNVRELRNAMEHAAVVCGDGLVLPAHLPQNVCSFTPGGPAGSLEAIIDQYLAALAAPDGAIHPMAVAELEKAMIRRALHECQGSQTAAAAKLGLHRNTLRNKIREFGLGEGDE